jgi:2,3-bisphosphoglycerate-independent phosphoglycerate mutase
MDRDNRWDRVEKAYDLLVDGTAEFEAPDAETALEQAYARGETDEFVKPTRVVPPGEEPVRICDGDVVINMNYRSDRVRQITRALVEPGFDAFRRKSVRRLAVYVSLTEYSKDFTVPIAFPPERLKNGFGE